MDKPLIPADRVAAARSVFDHQFAVAKDRLSTVAARELPRAVDAGQQGAAKVAHFLQRSERLRGLRRSIAGEPETAEEPEDSDDLGHLTAKPITGSLEGDAGRS